MSYLADCSRFMVLLTNFLRMQFCRSLREVERSFKLGVCPQNPFLFSISKPVVDVMGIFNLAENGTTYGYQNKDAYFSLYLGT
jgi:hypothetical protein